MDDKHWVSVAASIYDEQRDAFLIIQRMDDSSWQPPGGVLERNESLRAGVVREVKEETGADVEVVRLSGLYKDPDIGVLAVVFQCSFIGGDLRVSSETRAVEWIPLSRVRALVNESYACRLFDALESPSEVPVRLVTETRILT